MRNVWDQKRLQQDWNENSHWAPLQLHSHKGASFEQKMFLWEGVSSPADCIFLSSSNSWYSRNYKIHHNQWSLTVSLNLSLTTISLDHVTMSSSLMVVAAMQGVDQRIRSSLGFSILPKDTLTCRLGNWTSDLPITRHWLYPWVPKFQWQTLSIPADDGQPG